MIKPKICRPWPTGLWAGYAPTCSKLPFKIESWITSKWVGWGLKLLYPSFRSSATSSGIPWWNWCCSTWIVKLDSNTIDPFLFVPSNSKQEYLLSRYRAQEKTGAREGDTRGETEGFLTLRVSPSRAPVLSFTHYFQAPATQASPGNFSGPKTKIQIQI